MRESTDRELLVDSYVVLWTILASGLLHPPEPLGMRLIVRGLLGRLDRRLYPESTN